MITLQLSRAPSCERAQAQPCALRRPEPQIAHATLFSLLLNVTLAAAPFTNPIFAVQCEQGQAPAEGAAGADCSRRGSHEA